MGDDMKIIKQIFVILVFYVLGEIIAFGIKTILPNVFIPGTIIGLALLLVALLIKKIPIDHVDDVGSFLTSNMAFFFIPAAVSVLEYVNILQASFVRIIYIIVISIVFSFFMVALSVKATIILQNKYKIWRAKKGSDGNA
jgi:holin-like protein